MDKSDEAQRGRYRPRPPARPAVRTEGTAAPNERRRTALEVAGPGNNRVEHPSGSRVTFTVEALKHSILHDHRPGDRLETVEELSARFAVSRSVVREALSILRAVGLVDVRHGDGSFVRAPRVNDLNDALALLVHFQSRDNTAVLSDLVELRRVIECSATGLAAARATSKDLARVGKACEDGIEAATIDDAMESDMEFHAAIVAASHNSLLSLILEVITPLLRDLRWELASRPDAVQTSRTDHQRILESLMVRDVTAAEREAVVHSGHMMAQVARLLIGIKGADSSSPITHPDAPRDSETISRP